jgi:hypothetical protein
MDLMRYRSGIGAKGLLEEHPIPVVSDLPGVGQNYKGKSFTEGGRRIDWKI